MNKIKGIKQANWFLLVLAAISIIKIFIVKGLVIYPIPTAACDDGLLEHWAMEIAAGNWTGAFNCYTFIKEVGFAFYLAVLYRLHLPYILTTNVLYMVGCLVLLYAISHIVKKKWVLCVIYVVMLFNPIMTALQTGQRVYRNSFAVALTIWVFGCLLNLYFEITEKSWKRNCIWAILAAGSLGVLWETKSDTIWLLPFTVVVLLVAAVVVMKKRREIKVVPRLIVLILPMVGIVFVSKAVDLANIHTYGYKNVEYYGAAMSALTSVDSEERTESISLSLDTFQRLCELSPTLATAKEEVEEQMELYNAYDTNPSDGNVEDGWIGWALIGAFDEAGYYEDCQTANEFYKKVYEELEAAYAAGEIKRVESSTLGAYHMDTAEKRKELMRTVGQIWNYVASHYDLKSELYIASGDNIPGSQSFEMITNEKVIYDLFEKDYYCVGWVAYPQYDLDKLQVYIEDFQGNQLKQIKFKESEDVKAAYENVKGTDKCRFVAEWDYDGEAEEPEFYIVAYSEGRQVVRARITSLGLQDTTEEECIGSIDGFLSQADQTAKYSMAEKVVKRCNTVASIYETLGKVLVWAGIIAYVIATILFVWEWKNKHYENVNAWLVITGILLSLLVLYFGVAVTHLENCPAISYMYLSAAYPLLDLAALLAITKCVEKLWAIWKKRA